jgi:hypothetical protein
MAAELRHLDPICVLSYIEFVWLVSLKGVVILRKVVEGNSQICKSDVAIPVELIIVGTKLFKSSAAHHNLISIVFGWIACTARPVKLYPALNFSRL